MDCECQNWAREKVYPLTKHHPNCRKYDLQADATEIINALLNGILCWSADEEGVHYECFDAFRDAAIFVGRPEIVQTDKKTHCHYAKVQNLMGYSVKIAE